VVAAAAVVTAQSAFAITTTTGDQKTNGDNFANMTFFRQCDE
jgi:hypothetical protein